MRRTFLILLALVSLLIVLPGCGRFWVDPYITVTESQLNWIEIHYYNLNRKPIRRTCVSLQGTGLVELKKGTSTLVSDDFAKRHRESTWSDIRTARMQIDPAHVKDIMQNLVNFGLLDWEKNGRKSKKETFDRFIAVKCNINNYAYNEQENMFEADPDLAEQLLDVVREFDNPTL